MPDNRYAPPDAAVRDVPPATDANADVARASSIAELTRVVANAMAYFDKLPGARAPDRGGGLTGAAQRDVDRRSSNFVLIRLGSGALLFGVLIAIKASFALTGAVCGAVLVLSGLSIWRAHRRAAAQAVRAVLAMPEPLRAVASQLAGVRLALPPSYGQLAEALETLEARMAQVFNGSDSALATALLKLTGKVFGYAGFEPLAAMHPGVAAPMASLKSLVAQALQGRDSPVTG